MSKFYVKNHQGKANAIIAALRNSGFEETAYPEMCDVLFTDFDGSSSHDLYLRASAKGKRKITWALYPHSARPPIFWDGYYVPREEVDVSFVVNDHHREILSRIGYTRPMESVGWLLSDVKPFRGQKKRKPEVVCFAPIHPNANGWLSPIDKDLNIRTFNLLLRLMKEMRFRLKVRFIHTLEQNGIYSVEGVQFIPAKPDGNMRDAMQSDVVVAHQTYAYISVALGIPTVMMGEHLTPRYGNSESSFSFIKSWDKIRDLVQYPLDILSEEPDKIMMRAFGGSKLVEQWKTKMIGQPFSSMAFIDKLTKIMNAEG